MDNPIMSDSVNNDSIIGSHSIESPETKEIMVRNRKARNEDTPPEELSLRSVHSSRATQVASKFFAG